MFETLYIAGVAAILFFVYLKVSIAKRRKRLIEEALLLLAEFGTVERTEKSIRFQTGRACYDVSFFYVPHGAELTVNSKTVWEVEQFGRSKLIKRDLSGERTRIIILYPFEGLPKRYINENEMVFVKSDEPFYNTYLVKMNELKPLLDKDIL